MLYTTSAKSNPRALEVLFQQNSSYYVIVLTTTCLPMGPYKIGPLVSSEASGIDKFVQYTGVKSLKQLSRDTS